VLTVSQEQPSLKRLTWEIHWLSPEGVEDTFKRTFFLHENSLYWEQYGLQRFQLHPSSSRFWQQRVGIPHEATLVQLFDVRAPILKIGFELVRCC
jgi:hypothetical protein